MKNYYEILEIDKKASKEIIDKAYKTLVKKYHPDLQEEEKQYEYEQKMKDINEAYDILSDDSKRTTYDQQLQSTTISLDEYKKVIQENTNLKQQIQNNEYTTNRIKEQEYNHEIGNTIENMTQVFRQQINTVRTKAYHDAYIEDMRRRGYKIKYKKPFKFYVKFVIYILLLILTCVLIYQIPVVKNYFTELYNNNDVFQIIVNIFKKTFSNDF